MENSSRFFANRACEYYPCHENIEEINCMFCYCPLYERKHCPGKPKYIEYKGNVIKSCMNCTFPHEAAHYDIIMQFLTRRDEGKS